MEWLFPRLLAAAAAPLAGGLLGALLGSLAGGPVAGALVGAVLGALLLALRDATRAHRLVSWLRGERVHAAPRDAGFWGEVGYRVERALRSLERDVVQERERLAQFLRGIEASPNGVLLLDANDQIAWCSRVAADHFGLDPERDLRQPIVNLVRAPAFVAHLQSGESQPLLLRGSVSFPTLAIVVRRYGDGQTLVLSQDITERERHDAMRRDFVANVSHEIRSPLTVLAGFVETLATLPLTPVEQRRVLALMTQQTQRMQTLVSDLLTLARLEGSPRPPAGEWQPVAKLMARVEADAMALSGGQHRIELDPGAPAEIAGAEAELISAFGNLANNAVRYTPAGGTVRLRWLRRADGGGQFEVVDTGIGIAKEHLPRLAERFYRVDGSRSRETGGTGLGLAIVKHVAQRHGGELTVESEPGRGSTFRITFPAGRVRALEPQLANEAA